MFWEQSADCTCWSITAPVLRVKVRQVQTRTCGIQPCSNWKDDLWEVWRTPERKPSFHLLDPTDVKIFTVALYHVPKLDGMSEWLSLIVFICLASFLESKGSQKWTLLKPLCFPQRITLQIDSEYFVCHTVSVYNEFSHQEINIYTNMLWFMIMVGVGEGGVPHNRHNLHNLLPNIWLESTSIVMQTNYSINKMHTSSMCM